MGRRWRILAIVLLAAPFGTAAVRWLNAAGDQYRRADFANIQFKLNSATAQTVVTDGDAAATVQAALNSWNAVQYTAIHFAPLQTTSAGISASDAQNVIALADSAASRSAVGSALAVTLLSLSSQTNISEADIVLNPDIHFSTTRQPSTIDLQAVIAHELGHSIGANHAVVLSATMFYNTGRPEQAQLKPDDASFAVDVYPGPGADSAYGTIAGTALKDGGPLLGAEVIASDPDSGVTIGVLSSFIDGSFQIRVPAGNYAIFAAPLSGAVQPGNFYSLPAGKVDTVFKATVAGGPDGPVLVPVAPGNVSAKAVITTVGGNSAFSIAAVGTAQGTGFSISTAPASVPSGQQSDVVISGPGIDGSITEQNLRLIGPGITIKPGSVHIDNNVTDGVGRAALRFTVDVAARSSRASVSIFIARGADTALLAGGITILPVKPFFGAGNVVDGASFKGTGVAPGELITLFGTNVGPASPTVNAGYDPATGALPTSLAGTSVTFDGIPAPILFTIAGQVNLQVPYEIAGRANTTIIVQNQGTASDPVVVPVLAAQPGIFTAGGTTQSITVNQDGSINSPTHPAPKGSVVTVYATGQGQVDNPVPTGKPAPGSPLSRASGVSVTIGGANATVLFGGLTPGFVGLLQINVEIPQGSTSGTAPVVLTIAGQRGLGAATIAVQ